MVISLLLAAATVPACMVCSAFASRLQSTRAVLAASQTRVLTTAATEIDDATLASL